MAIQNAWNDLSEPFPLPRPPAAPARIELRLLGDFAVSVDGAPVTLPRTEQRLLAHLACADGPVSRDGVTGTLWPDTAPARARASLRTCLWRARRFGLVSIRPVGDSLRLDPAVAVDLHRGTRLAHGALRDDAPLPDHLPEHLLLLGRDVLPHWFDEWLEPHREHYRWLRVQALEHTGRRLLRAGRPGAAAIAAAEAVAAEPLRDSAHWTLIRALAAEGNRGKAADQHRRYAETLRTELGISAPPSLAEILDRDI